MRAGIFCACKSHTNVKEKIQMQQNVILVIGGSSGIGLAAAQKLCDAGNVVYCGARSACPDDRISSLILDVTKPETIINAVEKILDETGRIDKLVYSAGCSMAAPVEFADEEDYRYLFEVNFFGALSAIRAVLPHMRAQNFGRIVLIGSMGGILPIAYDAFYSSSKAALAMLAKGLNLEVKPYGISAVAVLPGGTATRFTFKRKVYPEEKVGEYSSDMDRSVGTLAGMEQGGMSAQEVADTVLKALSLPEPPSVMAAGFINKTYYLSQKILPDKLTQYLISNQYNLN